LGTATTNAGGGFSIPVTGYTGWAHFSVTGGSQTNPATGATVTIPAQSPIRGIGLVSTSPQAFVATPLTTVATALVQEEARSAGRSLDDVVANTRIRMSLTFGIDDVFTTLPRDLTVAGTGTVQETRAGALNAGLAEFSLGTGIDPATVARAWAEDGADGAFDGLAFGNAVTITVGVPFPSGSLTSIAASTAAWLDGNPNNASGLVAADVDLSAILASGNAFPVTPRIQSVWNGHSPLGGGSTVHACGFNFGTAPTAFVNGTSATVLSATATEVEIETPAQTTAGPHDLRIVGNLGLYDTARSVVNYYSATAAPTITAIVPTEAIANGGSIITVTGTGFDPAAQVFIGGVQATKVGGAPPFRIIVASPPLPAGPAVVRVVGANTLEATVANGVTVKDASIGRAYDDSDFAGSHAAVYTKYAFSGADLTLNVGQVLWNSDGSGQGTFTRENMAVTAAGTTETTTTGTFLVNASGHGFQGLSIDAGTNATSLYKGTIHREQALVSGLTAGGSFYSYPAGAGLDNSVLSGRHGITMFLVTVGSPPTVSTGVGTIEYDGDGSAGVNMQTYERLGDGSSYKLGRFVVRASYNVAPDGELDMTLGVDEATPWELKGRVSPDGAVTGSYYVGTGAWQGRVGDFRTLRLADAEAPENFVGEWGGGSVVEKTFDDGGTFVPQFNVGLRDHLFETAGNHVRYFVASDGVKLRPNLASEELDLRGSVRSLEFGLRGQWEYEDGSIAGFSSKDYFLRTGKVATAYSVATASDRIDYGSFLARNSYFSKFSLSGSYNFLGWNARWLNPTGTISGDETVQQTIGTGVATPGAAVTIGGEPFGSFGNITFTMSRKVVDRLGMAPTFRFDTEALEYACGAMDNRVRFVQKEDATPNADLDAGSTAGIGLLDPRGDFLGFGATPESGATSFSFGARVQPSLTLGATYDYGRLNFGFDTMDGRTIGHSERGTYMITGTSFSNDRLRRVFTEGTATTATDSGTENGTISLGMDGLLDFIHPGRVWGGAAVGNDARMIVLVNFSSHNESGISVLVRRATSQPPLFDYGNAGFEKFFSDTNLPARTELRSRSGILAPSNQFGLTALDVFRYNDSPVPGLSRIFNTGSAAATATGGFTVTEGTTTWTGAVTQDGHAGFTMDGASTVEPNRLFLGVHYTF
jgi:hypothetical protein